MNANDDGKVDRNRSRGMSCSDSQMAGGFVSRLEDLESWRRGARVPVVRASLARRLGVSPSTLANIRRLRRKIIPSSLMSAIRAELISVLQSEMRRLEHEISIARQTGADHRADVFAEAEAHLAATKKLLDGAER